MTISLRNHIIAGLAVFVACLLSPVGGLTAGLSVLDESALIEIGQRLYQKGELADGTPSTAIVLGDVEVSGDHFTCMGCHRRSGLGGSEGDKFVLPIHSSALLTPRVDLYLERPAYTLDTFADAIGLGVNPTGAMFDPIMPKYDLPELETRAIFTYLKTLSRDYSPGLDEEAIHFATVVGPKVDPQQRKEMMTVISTYFKNKNTLTRNEARRRKARVFFQEYRTTAYRRFVNHTWELSGPASSWTAQLEAYYQQQPVFALVSGLVDGSWAPISAFCRTKKLPCILPNTDLPVVEDPADFYTLYYSKGLTLEAQIIRAELSVLTESQRVLQVARPGLAGEQGRKVLHDFLQAQGKTTLALDIPADESEWKTMQQQVERLKPDAIVLWLNAADLNRFIAETGITAAKVPTYLSSSSLNGDLNTIPAQLDKSGRVVHPFILPADHEKRFRQISSWLKGNRIELTNPRLQGQTFYACLLLQSVKTHIKSHFYRDYLLDMLDHRDNMSIYSGNYPHLSFGPAQRFLSKGAYLIDMATNNARWIVPGHIRLPE